MPHIHTYGLHELGYKIYLDRYALKDPDRRNLEVGNVVVAIVDLKGRREIGTVVDLEDGRIDAPDRRVTVELMDGRTIEVQAQHIDLPVELDPADTMRRVARGIAAVEAPEKRDLWAENFEWLLQNWRFVPGGRILNAAGTEHTLSYYNCYVLPITSDSRGGIFDSLAKMAEIMSRGGGVGINLSKLRPRHAYVKGVNGRSSGAVSWGALFSSVTGLIEQAGSRRGALMLILNDWHPDVFEFINSKRTAGQITNANISVGISNAFMDAVKADADWQLVFPDTQHPAYNEEWDGILSHWLDKGYPVTVYQTVKARDLWNAIIESAWASAEPGIWFQERTNELSNSYYYADGYLNTVNPCAEEPLPNFGICNLGALNLSRFYDPARHSVKWAELSIAVQYAVRFLDNVIDANPYFMNEIERQQLNERRVGLGIMGLGELLIRMKLRYGSPESIDFINDLMSFISSTAYIASSNIAAEKGSFPRFDAEKFVQSGFMRRMPESVANTILVQGMRNVTVLTCAPTGTTGTMINTSTGIEPYFSWVYYRQGRLGLHEERVPVVQAWYEENGEDQPLPDYFVTAMDLTPEEHVRVQAAVQRWIDAAISKTCNVPNSYTVEDTRKLYEYMYELGCKGGTIYRDGSRDEQVLMLPDDDRVKAQSEDDTVSPSQESPVEEVPAMVIDGATECPECGNKTLIHEEGCSKCVACGTSKCDIPVGRIAAAANGMATTVGALVDFP